MNSDSTPLKVLMICTVPTGPSGIPNVIFNLMRAFDRSDMEIGYVSINEIPDDYSAKLREMGIKEFVIPRTMRSPLSYIRKLAKICRKYDVIHVHGNSATMILEMLAGKIGGVKLRIAHAHNSSCKSMAIHRLALPVFHQLCNGRVACGTLAGKWLFGNRNFYVVANAVDSNKFAFDPEKRSEIRAVLGLNSKKVIGHIGYFMEVKNHNFLIDVFAKLHHFDPETHLLLLGDGPLRTQMSAKIKELGLENAVTMTGNVLNPQDYIQAMDAVCMPSLYEGLPLTIIEQQVNGVPILAADTITREADKSGLVTFLSLQQTADTWAQRLMSILKQTPRSSELSYQSRERVRLSGYDIVDVAQNLKQFYSYHIRNDHEFTN